MVAAIRMALGASRTGWEGSQGTMRHITLAIHDPKPEHLADLLGSMRDFKGAASRLPGLLQIGSWREESGGRILAIGIWESKAAATAAWRRLASVTTGVPFDQWEERSREILGLDGVV